MSGVSLLDILWLLIRENLVFAGTACICIILFGTIVAFGSKSKHPRSAYVTFTAILTVIEASLAVLLDILVRFFG